MPVFSEQFSDWVSEGDMIQAEVDGFTVTATIYRDEHMGAPWKEHDGHGEVSEWTIRDKAPGERVIAQDGRSRQYYDFAAAVAKAKAEGWDAPPYGEGTKGERAVRAAEADFKWLKAWCEGEWHWVGVAVTVERAGVRLTGKYAHAVWGTENKDAGAHLTELAEEEATDALAAARAKLIELGAPSQTE